MRRFLTIATYVLAIPSCLFMVGLALLWMPGGLGWWSSVEVRNETNEKLQVTVMSLDFQGRWHKIALTRDIRKDNAFDSITEFDIEPGKRMTFHYDSDDASANSLLITKSNSVQLFLSEPNPPAGGHGGMFRIQALEQLAQPPVEVVAAASAGLPVRVVVLRGMIFATPAIWILCIILLVVTKPRKQLFVQ